MVCNGKSHENGWFFTSKALVLDVLQCPGTDGVNGLQPLRWARKCLTRSSWLCCTSLVSCWLSWPLWRCHIWRRGIWWSSRLSGEAVRLSMAVIMVKVSEVGVPQVMQAMDDHLVLKPMVTWGTGLLGNLQIFVALSPIRFRFPSLFQNLQRKEKTPDPTESNTHEWQNRSIVKRREILALGAGSSMVCWWTSLLFSAFTYKSGFRKIKAIKCLWWTASDTVLPPCWWLGHAADSLWRWTGDSKLCFGAPHPLSSLLLLVFLIAGRLCSRSPWPSAKSSATSRNLQWQKLKAANAKTWPLQRTETWCSGFVGKTHFFRCELNLEIHNVVGLASASDFLCFKFFDSMEAQMKCVRESYESQTHRHGIAFRHWPTNWPHAFLIATLSWRQSWRITSVISGDRWSRGRCCCKSDDFAVCFLKSRGFARRVFHTSHREMWQRCSTMLQRIAVAVPCLWRAQMSGKIAKAFLTSSHNICDFCTFSSTWCSVLTVHSMLQTQYQEDCSPPTRCYQCLTLVVGCSWRVLSAVEKGDPTATLKPFCTTCAAEAALAVAFLACGCGFYGLTYSAGQLSPDIYMSCCWDLRWCTYLPCHDLSASSLLVIFCLFFFGLTLASLWEQWRYAFAWWWHFWLFAGSHSRQVRKELCPGGCLEGRRVAH